MAYITSSVRVERVRTVGRNEAKRKSRRRESYGRAGRYKSRRKEKRDPEKVYKP